jgi:hypothetical protein
MYSRVQSAVTATRRISLADGERKNYPSSLCATLLNPSGSKSFVQYRINNSFVSELFLILLCECARMAVAYAIRAPYIVIYHPYRNLGARPWMAVN